MHAELTWNNYSKSTSNEEILLSVIVTEDKNDHRKDQGGMLKYIKSSFTQMACKNQGRTPTWPINKYWGQPVPQYE